MKTIEKAKSVWIVFVGGFVAVVAALLIFSALFLDKPLAETCEEIHWQGRQCRALKGVEWAKAHDLPPHTVEGYYSLPEDER